MNKYLLLLLTLCASNVFAANKWIDDQGRVHYSDQPAPARAHALSTLATSTPEVPAAAASGVSGVPATQKTDANDPAKLAAAKKAAADKAAQDAATKAQNQANCLNARQNLANLKDGMRIAVIDPNTGERSYMDDTQRQQGVNSAQQQISQYCK